MEVLNDCIDKWCNRDEVDKSVLTKWTSKFISNIDEKTIYCLETTHLLNSIKMWLQQKETDILNDIHNEYFAAPIDKAHSNFAFAWQSFYALVLIKELGLDQHTTSISKTYIQIN